MPKIILTGDRPTGPLHLGHYLGSLANRIKLQNQEENGNKSYELNVLIADMQALTDHFDEPDKIAQNVLEVTLDYLAVGIDPKISTICLQSQLPAISELTMYYLNLLTLNQIERNPTVKEEIKQKNFENKLPVGFLIYPVHQAADITSFGAELVPVGADQIPMIEDTNAIVRKMNQTYKTEVLKECEALVPSNFSRLVGLDGKAKMSKSLGNAIYLKDDSDTLWKKVKQMYTDPNHLKVEDPGQVEGNVCFTYLDAFGDDKEEIQKLKDHYSKGGLGDMKVKKYVCEVLEAKLKPIRERREEFSKDIGQVEQIIKEGTKRARELTDNKLQEIKSAMQISYKFLNSTLQKT